MNSQNIFFNSYFNTTQIIFLMLGGAFLLTSLYFQLKKKYNISIIFLGLGAFCIFCFAALLDPFLNLWDERFHALVGKNLIKHPLMPTLYDDPIVQMEYDRWDRYHIWLHKQPLFLWQIALSFKLFGISEFTLRLPSVILGTILVLITYRSGKLLVNQRVGYIAALLTLSTLYIIELIAGRQELDHNDVSFLVYISLSVWSLIEYQYTHKKIWIYLIGLFAGMAILCKWLMGLIVYLGWIVLRFLQKRFKITENKDILLSLLITVIISAPWQIYILLKFPTEAIASYKYTALHFKTTLEGHGGDLFYHFKMMTRIYGSWTKYLIIPAFITFFIKSKDKKLFYSLSCIVIIVYVFYSLAATKMPSYTIIVAMINFIAFATLIDFILNYFSHFIKNPLVNHLIFAVSILTIFTLRFDINTLRKKHTLWKENNYYTRMMINNKKIFTSLKLPPNSVLFNVEGRYYVDAMFYTGLPAYNFFPSSDQCKDLTEKGKQIVILNSNNKEIPAYLKNDPAIMFVKEELICHD
ncbi:MAG TPA: glycosyltransferase family 39 protein [Bacteroidales bacterium]|nr:glycosyltransferase family 39 protein [Bacteroidales bacterium]